MVFLRWPVRSNMCSSSSSRWDQVCCVTAAGVHWTSPTKLLCRWTQWEALSPCKAPVWQPHTAWRNSLLTPDLLSVRRSFLPSATEPTHKSPSLTFRKAKAGDQVTNSLCRIQTANSPEARAAPGSPMRAPLTSTAQEAPTHRCNPRAQTGMLENAQTETTSTLNKSTLRTWRRRWSRMTRSSWPSARWTLLPSKPSPRQPPQLWVASTLATTWRTLLAPSKEPGPTMARVEPWLDQTALARGRYRQTESSRMSPQVCPLKLQTATPMYSSHFSVPYIVLRS